MWLLWSCNNSIHHSFIELWVRRLKCLVNHSNFKSLLIQLFSLTAYIHLSELYVLYHSFWCCFSFQMRKEARAWPWALIHFRIDIQIWFSDSVRKNLELFTVTIIFWDLESLMTNFFSFIFHILVFFISYFFINSAKLSNHWLMIEQKISSCQFWARVWTCIVLRALWHRRNHCDQWAPTYEVLEKEFCALKTVTAIFTSMS